MNKLRNTYIFSLRCISSGWFFLLVCSTDFSEKCMFCSEPAFTHVKGVFCLNYWYIWGILCSDPDIFNKAYIRTVCVTSQTRLFSLSSPLSASSDFFRLAKWILKYAKSEQSWPKLSISAFTNFGYKASCSFFFKSKLKGCMICGTV